MDELDNYIGRHALHLEGNAYVYTKVYPTETLITIVDLDRAEGDTVVAAAINRDGMIGVMSCLEGFESVAAAAFGVSVAQLVEALAENQGEEDESGE